MQAGQRWRRLADYLQAYLFQFACDHDSFNFWEKRQLEYPTKQIQKKPDISWFLTAGQLKRDFPLSDYFILKDFYMPEDITELTISQENKNSPSMFNLICYNSQINLKLFVN